MYRLRYFGIPLPSAGPSRICATIGERCPIASSTRRVRIVWLPAVSTAAPGRTRTLARGACSNLTPPRPFSRGERQDVASFRDALLECVTKCLRVFYSLLRVFYSLSLASSGVPLP